MLKPSMKGDDADVAEGNADVGDGNADVGDGSTVEGERCVSEILLYLCIIALSFKLKLI